MVQGHYITKWDYLEVDMLYTRGQITHIIVYEDWSNFSYSYFLNCECMASIENVFIWILLGYIPARSQWSGDMTVSQLWNAYLDLIK